MNFKKLVTGIVIAMALGGANLVQAKGSSEEQVNPNTACMINLRGQYVNVNYIKRILVEDEDEVMVELASNYASKARLRLKYRSEEEALRGAESIADNVNDCALNVKKRQMGMKR